MKNTVKITPKGAVKIANGEAAERSAAAYALNLREREDALASVGNCLNIGSLCNGERVVLADNCGETIRLLSFLPNEPTNPPASAMEGTTTPTSAMENTTTSASTAGEGTIAEGHSAEDSATDGTIFWHSTTSDGAATAVGI